MSDMSWFRSWHGAPSDPKWSVISVRSGVEKAVVIATAWELLDYASQNKDRGSVAGFDTETWAVFLNRPEDEIKAVIKAMEDKDIIRDGWFVNWEKRQPKREDDSRERVRNFRERNANVTPGNASGGDVTPQRESKSTDTEKDTDTEGDDPPPPDDRFTALQRVAETAGIMLASPNDEVELSKLIQEGATADDLKAGIAWFRSENGGKPVKYLRQILGPTRTAALKRKQGGMIPVKDDPFERALERYQ